MSSTAEKSAEPDVHGLLLRAITHLEQLAEMDIDCHHHDDKLVHLLLDLADAGVGNTEELRRHAEDIRLHCNERIMERCAPCMLLELPFAEEDYVEKPERVLLSGNPNLQGSRLYYGWKLKLCRATTEKERRFMHDNGWDFFAGRWRRKEERSSGTGRGPDPRSGVPA